MSEEGADEVIGRLGGPSKIAKLEKAFAEAVVRLEEERQELKTKIEEQLQIVRVSVGAQVHANDSAWTGMHGSNVPPTGICVILALGSDWCVIRDDKGDVYCKIIYDISSELATNLVHQVTL